MAKKKIGREDVIEALAGFAFGGAGAQRALLEAEGVPFLPDGRVDLPRCRWENEKETL